MAEPLRYRYQPKLLTMLAASVLFGACAAWFIELARRNDRGVVISGLFHLETSGASVFYGLLAAASAGFVLIGLYGVARVLGPPRYVVLSDDALELPPGPFRGARRILLRDVRALASWTVNGQTGARIEHRGGVDHVAQSMLGQAAFDELIAELKRRCHLS